MSAQNLTANRSAIRTNRISTGRLWKAGLAAILAAVIANVITRLLLGVVMDLDPAFPPFTFGPIILFTTLFTFVGVLVFALVNRLSANPLRTYTIIGVVALVLSILPNIGMMLNPSAAPFPGGSALNFGILILFHIVAAVAFLVTLNALARER